MTCLKISRSIKTLVATLAVGSITVGGVLNSDPALAGDWAGRYAGVSLGIRAMDADWKATQNLISFGGPPLPFPFLSDPNDSLNSTDFRGALYAGYNIWTRGRTVIGLEADVGVARNEDKEKDRIPGLSLPDPHDPGIADSAEVKATWDASLRVRAGFLVTPDVLLYGTGGVAFQRVEVTATCIVSGFCTPRGTTRIISKSSTRVGWTIGAGFEAMLRDNWLIRAEYRYADYGSLGFKIVSDIGRGTFANNAKIDVSTHTASIGLAYKF